MSHSKIHLRYLSACFMLLCLVTALAFQNKSARATEPLTGKPWAVLKARFLAVLDDSDQSKRMAMLQEMKKANNKEASKLLLLVYGKLMKDELGKPPQQRARNQELFLMGFAEVLGAYHEPEALEAIIKYGLKSKKYEVMKLAVEAFIVSGDKAGLSELTKLLKNRRILRTIQIRVIRALGSIADPSSIDPLLKLADGETRWELQLPLLAAFRKLDDMKCVTSILPYLTGGGMKVRRDTLITLIAVTGQNFNYNTTMWKKWAEENKLAIENGAMEKGDTLEVPKDTSVVEYHGLPVTSDRVIFVVDTSKSMHKKYVAGSDGPDGEGPATTRLDAMKNSLVEVVNALPTDAEFSIVSFDYDVKTWRKEMTVATEKNKVEAVKYIKRMSLALGTDTQSAMEKAFEIAGAISPKGKPIVVSGETPAWSADTIYLLTDGLPWKGAPLELEPILQTIRTWNREAEITINTILLGAETGDNLKKGLSFLTKMAEQNHGKFVHY